MFSCRAVTQLMSVITQAVLVRGMTVHGSVLDLFDPVFGAHRAQQG